MQIVARMAGWMTAGLVGTSALAQAAPIVPVSGPWEKLIETSPMAGAVIAVVVILLRYISERDKRVEAVIDRNTAAITGMMASLERHGIETTEKS